MNSNEIALIAFSGHRKITSGKISHVALKLKEHLLREPKAAFLIFDIKTGHPVEIDLRGTKESILRRLEPVPDEAGQKLDQKPGPGRPKLGVISREVTLLPHHWEWLSGQSGGASVTLRKLVEEAKKKNFAKDLIRHAQEAAHRFMSALAGDLPGFEEALRSLYARDRDGFAQKIKLWPKDVREHVLKTSDSAWH
jgi:hypothetical protein